MFANDAINEIVHLTVKIKGNTWNDEELRFSGKKKEIY